MWTRYTVMCATLKSVTKCRPRLSQGYRRQNQENPVCNLLIKCILENPSRKLDYSASGTFTRATTLSPNQTKPNQTTDQMETILTLLTPPRLWQFCPIEWGLSENPKHRSQSCDRKREDVFYFPFEVHKIVCIPGIRNAVSKAHSVDAPHSKAGVGYPARCFPYSLSTCAAQVQTQAAMLAELSQLCHSRETTWSFVIMLRTLRCFLSIPTKPRCHLTFRGNANYIGKSYRVLLKMLPIEKMIQL